jgi:hypothetical protein
VDLTTVDLAEIAFHEISSCEQHASAAGLKPRHG